MNRQSTPFDYLDSTMQVCWMMVESQSVISMRVLGMAGLWGASPGENSLMLSEKVDAMQKGISDATHAAIGGKRLDEVTAAAIKPIRQKTKANYKRLSKLGRRKF